MIKVLPVALLVALFCACSTSCSEGLKTEGKRIASSTVDCGTAKAREAIAQYGGVVEAAVELATGTDGKVDRAKLADSAKSFAVDTGMCVLADLVTRHLAPKTADPNAPQSSALEADPLELRAAFYELAGGRAYQTPHGTL